MNTNRNLPFIPFVQTLHIAVTLNPNLEKIIEHKYSINFFVNMEFTNEMHNASRFSQKNFKTHIAFLSKK